MMQKKVMEILPMQAMKLPALPAPPLPPQGQMILMSLALVYLPLVLVYFLHIRLKMKNKTMIAWRLSMSKKNKINHQKDVICFSKKYIQ